MLSTLLLFALGADFDLLVRSAHVERGQLTNQRSARAFRHVSE